MKEFSVFENNIGVSFKNKNLLKQAFTHRSYLNENRDLNIAHNERLEFLGDAVLELSVTDYLYRQFAGKPEGELTALRSALVNAITLSSVASEIKINDFLLLSRGEAKDTGRARQYILANTIEALIGALYIDQGYDAADAFIARFILPLTESIVQQGLYIDAKSKIQETAQERLSVTPSYQILKQTGPDHDKHFTVGLYFGGQLVSEGSGKSKQDAEQEAARKALEAKGWQ